MTRVCVYVRLCVCLCLCVCHVWREPYTTRAVRKDSNVGFGVAYVGYMMNLIHVRRRVSELILGTSWRSFHGDTNERIKAEKIISGTCGVVAVTFWFKLSSIFFDFLRRRRLGCVTGHLVRIVCRQA